MAGSDDSGVVLSASDGPYPSSEVSASEKTPTRSSDNAVACSGDAMPATRENSPALRAIEPKDKEPQTRDVNAAISCTTDKDEPLATSEDHAIRDSDSDDEDFSEGTDVDDVLDSIRSQYDQHDIQERIKLAPKRVAQVHQYSRILEERLALLEKRAKAFDKKLRRLADGDDELPPPPPPPDETGLHMKPELNVQLSKGLRPVKPPSDEKPNPVTHQIDVFVGEPEAQKVERFRGLKTKTSILEEEDANGKPLSDTIVEHSSKSFDERRLVEEMAKIRNNHFPNRIRINGVAILYLFRKFTTGDDGQIDDVILRPFKPLLRNKDEIFSIMSEVESALTRVISQRASKETEQITSPNDIDDSKDAKGSTDVSDSKGVNDSKEAKDIQDPKELTDKVKKRRSHKARKASKETNPAETENLRKFKALQNGPDSITEEEWDVVLKQLELFDDKSGCCGQNMKGWPALSEVKKSFECLRELFQNYLLPGHKELRERQVTKVRFCDLWHLFQTGDLVVTKQMTNLDETETQDQLGMRILMTSGGRKVISPKMPAPVYPSPFKLSTSKDRIEPINGINPFCIHAYYLDYNGSRLVPMRRQFVIAPYLGERNILELEAVPIEYCSRRTDLLRERGKKFIEYVMASTAPYVDCRGLELCTREEINDRVIVDMKGYLSINPSEMPSFQEPEELDVSETSDCHQGRECSYSCISCYHRTSVVHDQMTDLKTYQAYVEDKPVFNPLSGTPNTGLIEPSDFIICHYRVFAYKLRSREWVHVNVKHLETPQSIDKNKGFEKLVLEKDHKNILESQVREHFRKKDSQAAGGSSENDMDLVRGKGQGLIILLHGAPGVGKTATAECIADLMEKPLYPITCGDLGSTADDVERNLKKHFTLASRWDCVMLLDEADVFLARRQMEDLQRNSIVSVFLRMLEYYKGLLFLTTNRVGTFDEAFTSRVHISLFYPDFTRKTTLAVWQTFIDQTVHVLKSSGRSHVTINGEEIIKFAKKHWKDSEDSKRARWNGRQIRNAFHTAVAMAEFRARNHKDGTKYDESKDVKISVGREEFEKIASTAREFDKYMAETMGTTFEVKASREGLRKQQKKEEEKEKKIKKKKQSKSKKDSDSSSSESESEDDDDAKKKKKKKKPSKSKKRSDSSSGGESEDDDDSDSD